jgi:hypothetical protein
MNIPELDELLDKVAGCSSLPQHHAVQVQVPQLTNSYPQPNLMHPNTLPYCIPAEGYRCDWLNYYGSKKKL